MFHQIFCFHICNINNEYSLFKKKNQITFHYKIYRWQEPTLCYEIISMYIMYKWKVWSKLTSSNNSWINMKYPFTIELLFGKYQTSFKSATKNIIFLNIFMIVSSSPIIVHFDWIFICISFISHRWHETPLAVPESPKMMKI